MAYQAIVSTLTEVEKHPNADRLKIAKCRGYNVVVGLESQEGDVVILFPEDGQLSTEYATANDLVRRKDENGNNVGGMFDQNRRIRTQSLRGVKSEAYCAPLSSVEFTGVDVSILVVGYAFDSLNNVPICNKYVSAATRAAANQNVKKAKNSSRWNKFIKQAVKEAFHEHKDTDNIRYFSDPRCGFIETVTLKMHGTSQRSAKLYLPDEKSHRWYHRLLNVPPKKTWQYLYGTRRVIRGSGEGIKDYRELWHNRLKDHVRKGETWYYEIVGFEDTGKAIMQDVNLKKLKDHLPKDMYKTFKDYYGDGTVQYGYGCSGTDSKIYVYRITVQDEDGHVNELPWPVVKNRCEFAGVEHVPELSVTLHSEFSEDRQKTIIDNALNFVESEEFTFQKLPQQMNFPHPDEGICVRIDRLDNGQSKIYKSKSFIFRVLEGIVKDTGAIDTEEAESL